MRRNTWKSPAVPLVEHSISHTLPKVDDKVADEAVVEQPKTESKVALSVKKGSTRGKNPREIEYMAFDLGKVETLPTTLEEFNKVTGTKDIKTLLEYLIGGYNDAMYSAASDEIGEFINDAWDKDTQNQFRLAVRNYSKLTASSIEDAVQLIKPGVDKAWVAKVAKAEADAKAEAEKPKEPVTA